MSRGEPAARRYGRGWTAFSVLFAAVCALLAFAYAARPDELAAITIAPVWAWSLPSTLLLLLLARFVRRQAVWLALPWVVSTLMFSDEPRSIARMVSAPAAPSTGQQLRIVSLNCAVGSAEAAEEALLLRPDLLLLQESPSRRELERLSRRYLGAAGRVIVGPDASILAPGDLRERSLNSNERMDSVQAEWRSPTGRSVEVVSLRLTPAVFRADLWNPECWRVQTENRRLRRTQLAAIVRRLPRDVPLVLAGDFNAPSSDAVFRELSPFLQDAFDTGGRGWPNTILNDYALLRIDQIWLSTHFTVGSLRAIPTQHSDHRMVVCDLN